MSEFTLFPGALPRQSLGHGPGGTQSQAVAHLRGRFLSAPSALGRETWSPTESCLGQATAGPASARVCVTEVDEGLEQRRRNEDAARDVKKPGTVSG